MSNLKWTIFHINSPCIQLIHPNLTVMHYLSITKVRINHVCILSVINQTYTEAININKNVWAIFTFQDDKELYITCLQFSYTIKLHFPYNIIYFPEGGEANAISFLLPSNNILHVKTPMEIPQHKLGFSRSYSKIDIFNPMQTLYLASLSNDKLQDLTHKIPEMK